MNSIPESYVDSMPSDPTLLAELGRVTWAAARLHAGVRDAINKHGGSSSMQPFERTLGQAIGDLKKLAASNGRTDQVTWADDVGQPACRRRNDVIHAVTYTAPGGTQAIAPVDGNRLLVPDLREVSRLLIEAHTHLPA